MTAIRSDLIKRELARRASNKRAVKAFDIKDYCFDKQLAFILDPSKRKTAVCSRRSGKTVSCAADLVDTVQSQIGDVAYITLNRKTAKRIIWKELLSINKKFGMNAKIDNTELSLTMPNGNSIYLSGAKDAAEIEKFRGVKLRKIYIDECQSFRPYIKALIEDVLVPSLIDYDGSLSLIGTPGPVPAGFFFEISHNSRWNHYAWTILDNPFIEAQNGGKKPIDVIRDEAANRGVEITDPSIRREFFGEWAEDTNSLVIKFDKSKNIYTELPDDLTYVIGIDTGYNDADSISVIGYNKTGCFLIEEYIKNKTGVTELFEAIQSLADKYKPVKLVIDPAAGGAKMAEDLRKRYELPVVAAEKTRKLEFIELLNDDLRTGKVKTMAGSRFEADSYLVTWDRSNPQKPKISDSYHSDALDSTLYGWRECYHFYKQAPPAPKVTLNQYMIDMEEKEAEAMAEANKGGNQYTDVSSWADLGITDEYFDDFE